MSSYTSSVLLIIGQAIFWFLILFVWLPRHLFPKALAKPSRFYLFDNVVRMSFVSIVIVFILTFLNLFDIFSLIAAYIAVYLLYQAWVCNVPLLSKARQLWKAWMITVLDILDGRILLEPYLKDIAHRRRQNLVDALPKGIDLWWRVALGVVLITAGYLRLFPSIQQPAPASADFYPHATWFKGLAMHHLFIDGLYPYGAYAVLQVIHYFSAVDETILLRLTPGLVGVLLVAAIYWSVIRLTARHGPALLAAALYGIFGFSGWLPLPFPPQGDVLTVEIALIFVLPALVFLVDALTQQPETKTDAEDIYAPQPPSPSAPLLFFQAIACVFFVQPFVGITVLLAAFGALLMAALFHLKIGRSVKLANRALLAALVGLSPLLIGLAQGKQLHLGPLRWDVLFFGATLREGRFLPPPPPAPNITWLFTLGLAGVFVLLFFSLWRRTFSYRLQITWQVWGSALLVLTVLYQPASFGLNEYLLPHQVARVLTPVLVVVIGLVVHFVWIALTVITQYLSRTLPDVWPLPLVANGSTRAKAAELAAASILLLALLIPFPSILLPSPALAISTLPKQEYDSVANQIFRIKEEIPANRWTVVGYNESYSQVVGQGFFVNNEDFLDNYQPESWRFDPRRPELAIPSPHVFIFIEIQPFVVPGQSAEAAIKRDSIRQRLQDWVDRYQTLRNDMSLYYKDGFIAVYHIYRTPAEEERILTAIEQGQLPLNIPPPASLQQDNTVTQTTPINPPTLRPTPVVTYQVQRGDLIETVTFDGQIAPVDQQQLFFKGDGRVAQINLNPGDNVSAGQIIAQLERGSLERALQAAQADLDIINSNAAGSNSDLQQAKIELEIAQLNLEAGKVGPAGLSLGDSAVKLERAFQTMQSARQDYDDVQRRLGAPPGQFEELKQIWNDPWVWTVLERGELFERTTENYLTDQFFYEQANRDRTRNEIEVAIAERRVAQAQLRVDALKSGNDSVSEQEVQRARLEVARLEADLAALKQGAPPSNQQAEALADYMQQVIDIEQQLAEAKIDLQQAQADLVETRQNQSIDAQEAEIDLWVAMIELEQLQEQQASLNFSQTQSKAYLDRSTRDLEEARNRYFQVANDRPQPPELLALHQATMTYLQAKAANDRASISINPHEILLREHEVERAEINLARLQSEQSGQFNAEREYALLNIKQLETQLTNTQLSAPITGTLLSLDLRLGQMVDAFEPVGVVANFSQLEVIGDQLLPQVHAELAEGMPAIVSRINTGDEQSGIPARLRYLPDPLPVNLNLDEDSAANINHAPRVTLLEANTNLQLGDRVRVSVIVSQRKNVLWLPPQAINTNANGEHYVIVKNGDGGRHQVKIEVGQQTAQQGEIKSGLAAGEIVIGR